MADGGNFDDTRLVVDRIQHPVVPYSDSVQIHDAKLDATSRPRIFTQSYDRAIDSLKEGIGERFKFSPGRWLDEDSLGHTRPVFFRSARTLS